MTQLPPAFLEEVRARTPLAELIGGRVRLSRSGRQWKGCCPFHDEKTPSFQVYDDHFHCYGCGAHGDAVSFVMQSQGLGFMEAVTELAARAGLTVPKPSVEATAAEAARQDAFSVLEAAARAFARRLFLPEGRVALAYLRGRGLSDQTIRDFGLGWSGEGRGTLLGELGREGFPAPQLAAAGLLKEHENSSHSEFFFNRVMFPIRDARGRAVSFGARALGEGKPKYLNGPETGIFA
ncbi:MAG: DNA primase, partial [Acetobacteraceae bacterium]